MDSSTSLLGPSDAPTPDMVSAHPIRLASQPPALSIMAPLRILQFWSSCVGCVWADGRRWVFRLTLLTAAIPPRSRWWCCCRGGLRRVGSTIWEWCPWRWPWERKILAFFLCFLWAGCGYSPRWSQVSYFSFGIVIYFIQNVYYCLIVSSDSYLKASLYDIEADASSCE